MLVDRRRERAAKEIEVIAVTALRERLADVHGGQRVRVLSLAERVLAGELDAYAAADEVTRALASG